MQESKLIFIISQPRSGSTLLQKLLSNNEYVDTVSEPWLLLPMLGMFTPDAITAKYNYSNAVKAFFDFLHKTEREKEFKSSLKKLILELYRTKDEKYFFVDKTPRYYEILPQIIDLFPNAKYLVLKRNPFASFYSMLTTWSEGRINYRSFNWYYRDFLTAPFLIQDFFEKNKTMANVKEVRYEDVVSEPGKKMGEIYDWLDIPFNEKVLDINDNKKTQGLFGDDVYRSAPLSKINSDSKDSWKTGVSDKEVSNAFYHYQEYLTPKFLAEYGYGTEKFRAQTSLFKKNEFLGYIEKLKSEKRI